MASDDEVEIRTLAFDHVWRWYEHHIGRAYQVLNFLLIGLAILATAYVGSLSVKSYWGAAAICACAIPLTMIGYWQGMDVRRRAELAEDALKELQDDLAVKLRLDSLRLVDRYYARSASRLAADRRSRAAAVVMVVLEVIGAAYALIAQ
ncbi:hypothetical protein [Nonomuraea jiangxiensis]|uniref:hypothetical protein n=1 Tax=Nonomuraea jiangxiensis TaxID=633440 RepID=UPI00115FE792|nr:hypothetical protein [Nonomuraea jiangxiensis]